MICILNTTEPDILLFVDFKKIIRFFFKDLISFKIFYSFQYLLVYFNKLQKSWKLSLGKLDTIFLYCFP